MNLKPTAVIFSTLGTPRYRVHRFVGGCSVGWVPARSRAQALAAVEAWEALKSDTAERWARETLSEVESKLTTLEARRAALVEALS